MLGTLRSVLVELSLGDDVVAVRTGPSSVHTLTTDPRRLPAADLSLVDTVQSHGGEEDHESAEPDGKPAGVRSAGHSDLRGSRSRDDPHRHEGRDPHHESTDHGVEEGGPGHIPPSQRSSDTFLRIRFERPRTPRIWRRP